MNILIVSTSDIRGGAAIAAYRLMNALKSSGKNVKMLVCEKLSNNSDVVTVGNKYLNKWNFYKERADIFFYNRFSKDYLFDISIANTGLSITDLPEFKDADIIHLHWINQGMLSLKEIENIIKSGKKVVWTMHDMWPFTGICHHAGECTNYKKSCGMCPYLKTHSEVDLSYRQFIRKKSVYLKGDITFVACSNWLKELALNSPLTKTHNVFSIPNPINTKQYAPKHKTEIRDKLKLPQDKKIILFVAAKASDQRKGVKYLIDAAELIAKNKNQDILFMIVGSNGDEIIEELHVETISTGYITNMEMADFYSAADLYISPSIQENLPNTIMEAMACGTPCVGFNIGGVPEMIEHKHTGYIANYKDSEDLYKGIMWVLNHHDIDEIGVNARIKVESEYEQLIIAKQYLEIYRT